jgi:hypothetical protein
MTHQHIAAKTDSVIDENANHRRVMASIISDLVNEGLVKDAKDIVWTALTDSILVLNGQTQPESLHRKFKERYHVKPDAGYYYGSVQITGTGYFFNADDFRK